jgi:hypothetical protein
MKIDRRRWMRAAGLFGLALSLVLVVSCAKDKDATDATMSAALLDTVPVRVEFDPPATTMGGPSTGRVTMSGTVNHPTVVTLTPSSPNALSSIPPTVTVAANAIDADFPVTVSNSTPATYVNVAATVDGAGAVGRLDIVH